MNNDDDHAPLNVPFVRQIEEHSCGAAALEMVYRYCGHTTIKQAKIFRKAVELEPHATGNFRMSNGSLIKDALDRNLYACPQVFDVSSAQAAYRGLGWFLVQNRVPVIACQQLSLQEPLLGHYRVIVGLAAHGVILHDPKSQNGSEKWDWDNFIGHWQGTGKNVVTGGAVIVLRHRIEPLPTIEAVRGKLDEYRRSIAGQ